MDTKEALKAHMAKGKNAHPDANVKKLAKGGPTGASMKAMGRNMARAVNQRGTSRGR